MSKRVDHLGLRSAMADRLLPLLVAAMSFLAALTIAGFLAASSLAAQWGRDSGAALTIQVVQPDDAAGAGITRLQAVLGIVNNAAGVSAVQVLSAAQVAALLQPWLGDDAAQLNIKLPVVITAIWAGSGEPQALRLAVATAAPGSLVETGARWAARVAALTASLQASAVSVLLIVAAVAAAVISVATRAGLAQRRETIEIIHALGALDDDIATSFAKRSTRLAVLGAIGGAVCALPVLYWLASLTMPFAGLKLAGGTPQLPAVLWLSLPVIPVAAAGIGWLTTQFTVRGWLRRLA